MAGVHLSRLLLVIVVGGALAMALIFLLARPYLRRPEAGDALAASPASRALLTEAEHQLHEGNVFRALRRLDEGLRHPEAFSREEHHRLAQLRRQADLLAQLLDQPLEEIFRQAMQHRSDEEWNEKFQHYRGRTVVFDDVLRLDGQGRPILASYAVRVGEREARVALEDLTLLRQLPLDTPCRCLFGARLANCCREQGGVWVIRFEPESAVLLSDESAASLCCPVPLDKELLAVLKRQDEWLRR